MVTPQRAPSLCALPAPGLIIRSEGLISEAIVRTATSDCPAQPPRRMFVVARQRKNRTIARTERTTATMKQAIPIAYRRLKGLIQYTV